MLKTETVRARVSATLKADVEGVLKTLGLSMSEAIHLFLAQVRLNRGLPFTVQIPNAQTQQTFEATDRGDELFESDLETFFQELAES